MVTATAPPTRAEAPNDPNPAIKRAEPSDVESRAGPDIESIAALLRAGSTIGEGVSDGVGDAVAVEDGDAVAVRDGVAVGVRDAVGDGVLESVGLGVLVGAAVGTGVCFEVAVGGIGVAVGAGCAGSTIMVMASMKM